MKPGAGLALAILLAAAGPPPPGASSCSGCHGAVAPIAGREAKDLTDALLTFRSGARASTVMGRIAKGFDTAELGSIAAWWAAAK